MDKNAILEVSNNIHLILLFLIPQFDCFWLFSCLLYCNLLILDSQAAYLCQHTIWIASSWIFKETNCTLQKNYTSASQYRKLKVCEFDPVSFVRFVLPLPLFKATPIINALNAHKINFFFSSSCGYPLCFLFLFLPDFSPNVCCLVAYCYFFFNSHFDSTRFMYFI